MLLKQRRAGTARPTKTGFFCVFRVIRGLKFFKGLLMAVLRGSLSCYAVLSNCAAASRNVDSATTPVSTLSPKTKLGTLCTL